MDFTIEFNSGGNHGHQLKDALGALTIGHLFNLNYVHRPYSYLDFFGIFCVFGPKSENVGFEFRLQNDVLPVEL